MSEITADRLFAAYIKLRNRRQEILRAFEQEDNELKAQQELISDKMLEICKEVGADSFKTQYGTVSRTTKTRYWTNDWASMYEFIKEHDAPQLLEQRLHQGNLKTFLEENPEQLPPGLNADSRYAITVRKR